MVTVVSCVINEDIDEVKKYQSPFMCVKVIASQR